MQIADMLRLVCGGVAAKRMALAIGFLLALVGNQFSATSAAEYEVVGVLAYAVEPEVGKEIGLTENQLKQLNELINNAEAEILTTLSDLKDLPTGTERKACPVPSQNRG